MRVRTFIIIIVITLLLAFFASYTYIYYKADQPRKEAFRKAEERVLKENLLVTVSDFYVYNGSTTWTVVTGENENGKKLAVFIPDEEDDEIQTQLLRAGITEEKARKIIHDNANIKKILAVNLGLEYGSPLWEVSYLDTNNTLHYVHIDFFTGDIL